MKVLHTFEDGWTIRLCEAPEDRMREYVDCHRRQTCLGNAIWDERTQSGNYVMGSLYDPEDNPRSTIIWADAQYALEGRAGVDYRAYITAKIFDQFPRSLPGIRKSVVTLQFCPPGMINGDTGLTLPETIRVKNWFESLPKTRRFRGWDTADMNMRSAAEAFRRTQREKAAAA